MEERKRALVAQSEVYRQTMTLEVQNLGLYTYKLRQKFAFFSAFQPLVFMGVPLIGSLLRRRRAQRRRRGFIGTVLLGMRLYRQFAPMIQQMLQRRAPSAANGQEEQEATAPAANI